MKIILFALILSLAFIPALQSEFVQDAEGLKAKGNSLTEIGSKKVCGDRLCSEVSSQPSTEIESSAEEENNVTIIPVQGNVLMLIGFDGSTGGNIGVSAGNDGLLIVDDGVMPALDDIKSKLSELKTCNTCGNVEFLLNTHWHFDHVENNANFDRDGAVIIAHSNVRELLSGPQELTLFGMKFDASPKEALPVITFDESISVYFNDEEIQVIHVPNGHTNSDSIVYFTESNVLHLGDHFFNGMFPFVDLEHGGSVQGLTGNIEQIIDEFPVDVKIIPGHGSLANMNDLIAYHDMLVETTKIIQDQIEEGKTLEEIQDSGFPTKLQEWGNGFLDQSTWIKFVYTDLSIN
jgi:glyoxylase-like metal-dependent hydrolase (beta-lactamase superfamily II)